MMLYNERDLVRVTNVRPVEGGQFELDDGRASVLYDFTPSAIYVGTAPLGAATDAAVWTIHKITLDSSGNPASTSWTDVRTAVWDDRVTESYS